MSRSLVFLSSLALILVGCTQASDQNEMVLPPKNRHLWVMPLDEFTDNSAPLRDYAEALLDAKCLARAGITWPVPWQPTDRALSESYNSGGRRIFNSELARSWGYHRAPNSSDGFSAWQRFTAEANRIATSTKGFDSIFDDCLKSTRDLIPLPSDDARDYARMAAHQISAEALLDSTVISAQSEWQACMIGAGFVGLPDSPNEMPPESLRDEFNLGVPGTLPSPDEIQLALADAECSESSGYTIALYEAEWGRQATFVEANMDKLFSLRNELDQDHRRLLSTVSENAPTN